MDNILKRAQELKKKQEEAMAEEKSRQQLEKKRIAEKEESDRITSKKRITQFIQLMTSRNADKDKLYNYAYVSYKPCRRRKSLIGEGWVIKNPYHNLSGDCSPSPPIAGIFLLCSGQLCSFDNCHQKGSFFLPEIDFLGGNFERLRDSNIFASDEITDLLAKAAIRYRLV